MHGLNSRQQKFAELYASGMAAGRAYEAAGYDAKGAVADVNACQLLRNPNVTAYVAELRGQASESAVLTIAEKRKFLRDVVLTPVGSVDENSPLCQEMTYEVQGGRKGRLKRGHYPEGNEVESEAREIVKIKMPSKLQALELDAKLAGEFAPQEVKVSGFAELLAALPKGYGLPAQSAGAPTSPALSESQSEGGQ